MFNVYMNTKTGFRILKEKSQNDLSRRSSYDNLLYLITTVMPLITKGESRICAPGAPPLPGLKKWDLFFVNFHCIIRKYFDFSLHAVFTICILFDTLLTKTLGYV